jgi:hypothetical protein
MLVGLTKEGELNGDACSTTWDQSEMHTKIWSEYLKGRYASDDLGMYRGITLHFILMIMLLESVD